MSIRLKKIVKLGTVLDSLRDLAGSVQFQADELDEKSTAEDFDELSFPLTDIEDAAIEAMRLCQELQEDQDDE